MVSEQQITRILLISSVATQGGAIRQVLSPPQYRLQTRTLWHDALAAIAHHCPDVIVFDPTEMNLELGSVCQVLRAAAAQPDLPILMILPMNGAITPAIAFAQGATDYLTSPLIPAELIARLRPYQRHTIAVGEDLEDQRQHALQALQHSERQNRALLSALPDLIIRLTGDGMYLDFRPTSTFHVFGDNSRIGCSIYDTGLPRELIKQRMTLVRKALQTGEIQIYEQQIEVNGVLRTEEVRIVVCAENEVLLVVRDISDRKRVEQQLRDYQSFLDGVINAIADLIFVKDEQHRFVLVNPAVAEFAGVPKEALIGRSDYDFFPTDQADFFWQQDEQVLSQGQELVVEEVLTHVELGLRVLNTRKTRLFDASGHRFLVGYSCDITEEKAAEEALRQSEERWQLAIEGTEDGIWDWDVRTQQVFRSKRWKTMLGYDEQELNSDSEQWFWVSALHPDDRDRVWNAQQRYLSRQTPNYAIEYRLRCKDGSYKWILSRGKAVWNDQGKAIRMVGSNTDISLQKQAEAKLQQLNENLEQLVQRRTQALQQQTSLLQTILNNMADGVLVVNTSGAILLRNPAAEKIAALSVLPVFLTAFDSPQVYLPDGITPCPPELLPLSQAMRGESADQVEIIVRYPDLGSDVHVEATVRPLTDGVGILLGGVAVFRDVTARKQAEKTLQDQTERLRLALESANLGAWEWDLTSDRETWSSQSETLFGFSPGEFDGSTEMFLSRIVPDDRDRVQQSLDQAMHTGRYRVDYRVAHPNGSIRWISSLGKIFYNSTNTPIRLLGLHMDLTEQKDAEAALRDSEERLRLALIAANQGLYDLNLQTGEAIVTPEYASMLGYDPAEFHETNAKWIERLHPDDQEAVAQVYRDYVAGRIPEYKVEFRQRTKAGQWKWILSLGKIVAWDAAGQPLRMLGTHTDIGDRKQVEQTLKDMNLELERRVEARTADLRQALEAAEAASRAKSTFLANMSHELRTPLNVILGFSQLMSHSLTLTPEQHEQVGIINRSGEHLLTLINDILEMSKIEAGRTTLNLGDFDLRQLINTLTDMFRLRADRKGLQFVVDVATDVPLVFKTDGSKLRQVLINLLSNAVKFTTRGRVSLRVSQAGVSSDPDDQLGVAPSDELNQDDCRLCFEVTDTGPGIAPDEFDLLFEPFAQTRVGQQTQEGTGLGLPISQAFVRLLGGELEVNSVVDQGSVFRFTIPVKQVERAIAPTFSQQRRIVGLAPGQTRYRILVVEDNEANRQLLVALFTALPLDVEAVENGQQAVWMWQHWQPHLIWMDIRMPIMDGYQATHEIRVLEAQAHLESLGEPPSRTVIIALTANAFEEQRARMATAGCDDFVPKPFQDSVLLDKMTQYLGVQFVYAEAIASTPPGAVMSTPANLLTIEQCALMPQAWMLQLYEAALELNSERIITLLQDVPDEHTTLAHALMVKVDNFDFEDIILFAQHGLTQQRD